MRLEGLNNAFLTSFKLHIRGTEFLTFDRAWSIIKPVY